MPDNYLPIDCGFYDHFEQAIVRRQPVTLVFIDEEGQRITSSELLLDLKTEKKAEFVQRASGEWLRLDRVVSIDGVSGSGSCKI